MDVLVERCAGLDVHRDTVVATVRWAGRGPGQRQSLTRTYRTYTRGLLALADWLVEQQVQLVGMESTGVYWKPVYAVLETRLPAVWLLNAQHVRNVPGRKTDVADSAWLAQLLECGLVRPSFVPPAPVRDLREFTRYRRTLIEERTREIQRVEKTLQTAGIKLSSVASKVLTKSGRQMVQALIAGETSPTVLADLAQTRLRAKIPELREALLAGSLQAAHRRLLAQLLAHIDFLEAAITEMESAIDEALLPFAEIRDRVCTIPGVSRATTAVLIAEIGVDMSVFPTAAHLASWAGICPGNHESGGKRRTGKTRHGNTALRTALTEAALAAARTHNTYTQAHYHQIRGRRGPHKAIGAIRHDLLTAYWHILHNTTTYHAPDRDRLTTRNTPEHQRRHLVHQLENLGYTVTLTQPAA